MVVIQAQAPFTALNVLNIFGIPIALIPIRSIKKAVFQGYPEPPIEVFAAWFISYVMFLFYKLATDDLIGSIAAFIGAVIYLVYLTIWMYCSPPEKKLRVILTIGFVASIFCWYANCKTFTMIVAGICGVASHCLSFLAFFLSGD